MEIKDIVLKYNLEKVLGVDGFNSHSNISYWHVIGRNVIAMISIFFSWGKLLGEVSITLLFLSLRK